MIYQDKDISEEFNGLPLVPREFSDVHENRMVDLEHWSRFINYPYIIN